MYSARRARLPLLAAVALAALVTAAPATVHAQRQQLSRYTTAQGLPAAKVTAILQDEAGYLWFGTTAGLARYDGSSYRVLTTAEGLSGNTVVALARDSGGRVIVATAGGGIDAVRGDEITPLGGEFAGRDRPRGLLADAGGVVWIATAGGVASDAQGTADAVVPGAVLPAGCCTVALRDRRDRIWLGTSRGMFRLHLGKVTAVDGTAAPVQALLDSDDGLWVGTAAGLFREQGSRLLAAAGGPATSITALAAIPGGGTWIGTATGEVFRQGAAPLRIDRASGLPEGPVNALLVDREGSLWIGTDDGVAKWVATSFVTFDERSGLPGESILEVQRADAGVWVASRLGVVRVESQGAVTPVLSMPAGDLSAIAPQAGGLLLGRDRQLWSWQGGESARAVAVAPATITAIAVGGDGIWVGTASGLYQEADGELRAAAGFPPGSAVTALAFDGSGNLWIGSDTAGLLVRRQGDIQAHGASPRTAVWDVVADADGSVWVATNGNGLLRVVGDEVVALTRAQNGLVSDFVQQAVPVGNGRVWAYTNHGLDFWDPVLGVTHYGLRDGLPSLTGNPGAGAIDGGGVAWFGTSAGLAVYRPVAPGEPGIPPQVRIEAITLDGTDVDVDELRRLGPDVGVLNFRYTALTFRDERSTRFQYRLLGRNDQWSRLTAERHVSFVGLPAGEYVFEVQAIDDRGRWSEAPATATVVIRPSIWQRIETRVALAALALLGVLVLFRRRLRTVDDERQRLRSMVDKRTLELVEKNALLERMATTDELTGLPNRRFFLESMQRELRKMARSRIDDDMSLLVIDLDRFKSINDRFGHAAGDEVLRQVARRLARGVRATDLPARYGGEEFAILLPSTGADGGRFLGEKLRADLEALDMRFEGTRIPVTISVGVASLRTPCRYEPEIEEDLLKRADEAMYQAKTGGRNRVVVAG